MSNSNIRVTIQTDKGMVKRRNDQYSVYLIPDDPAIEAEYGSLTAVADGLGGNINSNFASKISAESLLEFYYDEEATLSTEKKLLNAFWKSNEKLLQKVKDFQTPGMMSTLTAVLVHRSEVWVIHTGSSRAYIISSAQGLRQITTDNEIFIGSSETIDPEIKKVDVKAGDRILIITSGIYTQVSHEEIKKSSSISNTSQVIDHLIQSANHAGGEDNVTACVIDFGKFTKKASVIEVKKESQPKPPKSITTKPKARSSFWVWILILAILVSLIYLTWKFQRNILGFLLPGTQPQTSKVIDQNLPPEVIETPEASIKLSVTPLDANIFLYEGDISLNDKQNPPYFYTEKTPTTIKGLKVGIYTLIAGKNGYEPIRKVIAIRDMDINKTIDITLELKTIAQNTAPPPVVEPPKQPPVETNPPPIIPPSVPVVVQCELIVQSDPTGAKIFLNSQYTGFQTPNVLKVNPGTYAIQIMKDGYESASRTVLLSNDSNKQSVFIKLKPIPIVLTISSDPSGAKIYLDNIFTGKVTPNSISVGVGTHTITIAKAGFEEQAQIVTLSPGMKGQFFTFTLKLKAAKTLSILVRGISYAY